MQEERGGGICNTSLRVLGRMQELRGVPRGSTLSSSSDTEVGRLHLDCDYPLDLLCHLLLQEPARLTAIHHSSNPYPCAYPEPELLAKEAEGNFNRSPAGSALHSPTPRTPAPSPAALAHRIPILALLKPGSGTHQRFALQGAKAAHASARALLRAQEYRKAAVF